MSRFSTLLVPLDGSRMAARSLGCATWLAAGLETHLPAAGGQIISFSGMVASINGNGSNRKPAL